MVECILYVTKDIIFNFKWPPVGLLMMTICIYHPPGDHTLGLEWSRGMSCQQFIMIMIYNLHELGAAGAKRGVISFSMRTVPSQQSTYLGLVNMMMMNMLMNMILMILYWTCLHNLSGETIDVKLTEGRGIWFVNWEIRDVPRKFHINRLTW